MWKYVRRYLPCAILAGLFMIGEVLFGGLCVFPVIVGCLAFCIILHECSKIENGFETFLYYCITCLTQ